MNIDFLSCTFWTSHLLMPKPPKVLYGSSTLNKIIYLSCCRHFVLKRRRLLKRFVRDATETVKQLLKVSRMASKWAPGCVAFNLLATLRWPRGAHCSTKPNYLIKTNKPTYALQETWLLQNDWCSFCHFLDQVNHFVSGIIVKKTSRRAGPMFPRCYM